MKIESCLLHSATKNAAAHAANGCFLFQLQPSSLPKLAMSSPIVADYGDLLVVVLGHWLPSGKLNENCVESIASWSGQLDWTWCFFHLVCVFIAPVWAVT